MKTLLRIFIAFFSVIIIAFVGQSFYVSRPIFKEQMSEAPAAAFELASTTQALSFARTRDGKSLLVTEMNRDGISGVDLGVATGVQNDGPLDYVTVLGEAALQVLLDSQSATYAWDELGVPFDTPLRIIGAGVNFKAHAEETGLDDGPFLFPKLSVPTPWDASVARRGRLDYEVELCGVAVDDIKPGEMGRFAFVLCNDLTDRWALVQNIDMDKPMGLTGFPDAKGGDQMLPVGAILVVPQKADFYNQIELGLSVNGRLRQRDSASLMIWDAPAIAQRAISICDEEFYQRNGTVNIADCSGLKKGTAVLLGTPEGVAFQLPNIWMPWAYLRAGDRVLSYGSHLGVLRTSVID